MNGKRLGKLLAIPHFLMARGVGVMSKAPVWLQIPRRRRESVKIGGAKWWVSLPTKGWPQKFTYSNQGPWDLSALAHHPKQPDPEQLARRKIKNEKSLVRGLQLLGEEKMLLTGEACAPSGGASGLPDAKPPEPGETGSKGFS